LTTLHEKACGEDGEAIEQHGGANDDDAVLDED